MNDLSFKDILIGFLVASLFLIALISFAKGIAKNYGFSEDLMDESALDVDDIEAQIYTVENSSSRWKNVTTQEHEFTDWGSEIFSFSIWGAFKSMWESTRDIYSIMGRAIYNVLGVDPLVFAGISSILTIVIIFAVWRVIKTGQ